MGRRGPPPKPTALKLLQGNPGKRRINTREPKPDRSVPRCPSWLTPGAKRVWQRLVPQLGKMGMLTVVDQDALAAYCQTYARWRAAEEYLAKHGDVYPLRDDRGKIRYMQQFPQVAIARNLLLTLRAYQQEFGLTPSSRSRIEIPAEKRTNAFRTYVASKPQLGALKKQHKRSDPR